MTAATLLVEKLTEAGCMPRPGGGGWTSRCPAHDDRNPSLSVRQIEGQALVYCHAGCETTNVVEAVGLNIADLFDEPSAGVRYAYTDRTGTPTRYVHRTPDKRFRQSGATSEQPELYRLPAVIAAAEAGTPVYLVEGEKDVHALESIGAVATTSPMGSSNFNKVDVAPLTKARVIVVPDQDGPGKRYLEDALAALEGVAASVQVARPKVGKDAADHVAAGYSLDDLRPEKPTGARRLVLTRASEIKVRPVRWLWERRVALGSLALLGGREGIGKSTVAYTLAADVSRGRLPGTYEGQPKAVIVAATEDSWEHTIAPRLIAANADLERIFRVDITTAEGVDTGLSLPRDLAAIEQAAIEQEVALILLDPLMSRLDSGLDTHKDAEVRLALEPLTALANRVGAAVLGLIHVSKATSSDPLTLLMGSRAFAAVARAVLFVMVDPDDDNTRLLGEPKNNLGRTDLPTLSFTIESAHVADTDEGPVWTSAIRWGTERSQSIHDVLVSAAETADARSATGEAAVWLEDYLHSVGGTAASAAIKDEGRRAGHSIDSLKRARQRIRATSESAGFPRQTWWRLPVGAASESSHGESQPTASTAPTAPTGAVSAVSAVSAVGDAPRAPGSNCAVCQEPLLLVRPGRSRCARCEEKAA